MRCNKLFLVFSLLLFVFLSGGLVSAAASSQNRHTIKKAWEGTQITDLSTMPTIILGKNYVDILGTKMIVTSGYQFDGVYVRYEIIDYMRIFIDPQTFYSNPSAAYSAQRIGKITWYTDQGVFGSGVFKSKGGQGDLLVASQSYLIKGNFWVKEWITIDYPPYGDVSIPVLDHNGWYISINN